MGKINIFGHVSRLQLCGGGVTRLYKPFNLTLMVVFYLLSQESKLAISEKLLSPPKLLTLTVWGEIPDLNSLLLQFSNF